MLRVKFFMKNGNVIEFECESIITGKNGFGILASYEIEHGDSKRRLNYADISSIESITVEDID